MRVLSAATMAAFSLLFLTACNDKNPGDDLTSKVILNYATQDLIPGMEIADFKRDNGWVDTTSPNRYIVRYAYNLKLTKDLPEVVLDLAKAFQQEVAEKDENKGVFGGLESLNLTMSGSSWIAAQGDKFSARRNSFVGRCSACVDYWNKEGPSNDDAYARRSAYALAWSYVESLVDADLFILAGNSHSRRCVTPPTGVFA